MELSASKPLRIGILGAANIARQFAIGVAPSKTVTVAAVASRDHVKAEKFAHEYGIARSFGSYEAMLADPEIDAIYNPLPNAMHAEWSIKAVEAGKHVLCEKPLVTAASEARAMFEAARLHKVYLVEAYPYLAQQQTLRTRELIKSGAIGKLQFIRSSFGVPFTDPSNIRMKPDLGGGSLLDAGSYAVSFVRVMAGECPERVSAVARWSDTGVDNTIMATLEFASGLLAQVSCTFATGYHRNAMVAGATGTIETTYLNHPPLGGAPVVMLRNGRTAADPPQTIEVAPGNGFLLETESFQKLVTLGPAHWTGATPEESIDIALTLDAIKESARSGSPAKISR